MSQLPATFNVTFVPERQYLTKIVSLVSSGQLNGLSVKEVSDLTSIPTGKKTGKVIPTIKYGLGMGLINQDNNKYFVTDFGRVALENDALLNERISQLICHAMLCDHINGAYIWDIIFSNWDEGQQISIKEIALRTGADKKVFLPTLQMYLKENSFIKANILNQLDNETYVRLSAPIGIDEINGYGALFLHLWNEYFPSYHQIVLNEFDAKTKYSKKMGWNQQQLSEVMEMLSTTGFIKVSSLVQPIIIQRIRPEEEAWKSIYDNLL